MKPQIPNQKRKKSLKKQYDELSNAYSQFSRTKELKSGDKEDRILNIDQRNGAIQSFNSELDNSRLNSYMVREQNIYREENRPEINLNPREILHNLEPQVFRLNNDESRVLDDIY